MADTKEVEQLAIELMQVHDLLLQGWLFQWSNAKQFFGYCSESKKIISLSKPICAKNDLAECKDTILHEIAHALAGCRNGHNWHWKMACHKIGARPERCYDSKAIATPTAKYIMYCESGCKWYVHRKTKGSRICITHGKPIRYIINIDFIEDGEI
jgi:hypothetical protein